MDEEEARRYAGALVKDPARALETLAREELGLDPRDLGSPWSAALSSFFSFALGAAVPLVPFLAMHTSRALAGAIALSSVALFAVGAAISLFTGRGALAAARDAAIGAGAGALTWLLGRLLGVAWAEARRFRAGRSSACVHVEDLGSVVFRVTPYTAAG